VDEMKDPKNKKKEAKTNNPGTIIKNKKKKPQKLF